MGCVLGQKVHDLLAVDESARSQIRHRAQYRGARRALATRLPIVDRDRASLVFHHDSPFAREMRLELHAPTRHIPRKAVRTVPRLDAVIAHDAANAHSAQAHAHVGSRAPGDHDARIELREPGQQLPRWWSHRRPLGIAYDRRERAVVVEGQQHVRERELREHLSMCRRKDVLHRSFPSTASGSLSRPVRRSWLRTRVASTSIRPAQR